MLGFYVLLEDSGANVIIIALHCCSGVFLKVMTYAILLINPDRWQQANTQQPIGVVGLVIVLCFCGGFRDASFFHTYSHLMHCS